MYSININMYQNKKMFRYIIIYLSLSVKLSQVKFETDLLIEPRDGH